MKRVISSGAWEDLARAVRAYNAKPDRYGSAIRSEFRAAVSAIAKNPRWHSPLEFGPPDVELRVYHIRRFDLLETAPKQVAESGLESADGMMS